MHLDNVEGTFNMLSDTAGGTQKGGVEAIATPEQGLLLFDRHLLAGSASIEGRAAWPLNPQEFK